MYVTLERIRFRTLPHDDTLATRRQYLALLRRRLEVVGVAADKPALCESRCSLTYTIHTEMVRFGTRRLRNVDTRPETSLPNVAAGDADMFVANSLLWSDFRGKRRSEIVSAVNHGIGFALS